MGTTPEPDRIWIVRGGPYTRVSRTLPAGEACTEYQKVREIPAGRPLAAAEPEPPPAKRAPLPQRDFRAPKTREAKPAVRKAAKKTGGGE